MAKSRLLEIVIGAKDKTKAAIASVKNGFNTLVGIGLKTTAGLVAGFAAVTAGAAVLFSKTADVIDNLAKMSSRLGLAVEDLQAIRTAAGYAGVSVGEMDTAIRMMESNLSDAARGIGTAKDAIESLGLSAEELQTQGPAQALQTILDALGKIPDATNRTAAAMDIFGRAGAQILTLTSQSIRDARKEIDDLGIALSKDQTKAVEDANDAWSRFKSIFGGIAGQFTATMAPAVKAVSDRLVELASKIDIKNRVIALTGEIRNLTAFLVQKIPAGLLLILNGVNMVTKVISGWKFIWAGVNEFASGLTVKLAQAVLVAAELNKKFLESQNLFGQRTEDIKNVDAFIDRQKSIISGLEEEKRQREAATNKAVSDYEKQQKQLDEYATKIASLQGGFNEVAKAVEVTGKAVESGIKDKIESSVESSVQSLDRLIDKLAEVRKAQGSLKGQDLTFTDYERIE